MEVVLNYELEKDLLGFGEGVKVLSPRLLVHNMSTRLRKASAELSIMCNDMAHLCHNFAA